MALEEDDLRPGRILGPYELLIPVGSGGMAYVWAARHRQTQNFYALKILRPHLAENVAFREMFFDEARIASRIHHENVAETFELVELEGYLTLVMEWVDGSSLNRVLRPGPGREDQAPRIALPLRHAARIVAETCVGLHAAHELLGDDGHLLSVVHRDVSPHNVLMTLDGRVKVTDFGVAKALGKLHMTIAGQVKGKLAYMSPEQLVGGGIDRRSDVFALGTVLYEISTGTKPFTGDHDPQIMSQIIMGRFAPPSELVPNFPPQLESIILRAMSVEPENRFSTALQMRQALEGWLSASGPPVSQRQLSLLLYERCGQELTERGAGVFAMPPPPQSMPSSHPTPAHAISGHFRVESGSSAMAMNRRAIATNDGGKLSVVAGVFAVILGLALGLGVLFYVREARRQRAASVAPSDAGIVTIAASNTPPAPTSPTPSASAIAILGDIDDDPIVRASCVRLNLPEGARLFVDGQPLPPGTQLVARPDAGETVVLVRAEGKLDTIVTLSGDSPQEIDVVMKKKPRPNPVSTISIPPNPFD